MTDEKATLLALVDRVESMVGRAQGRRLTDNECREFETLVGEVGKIATRTLRTAQWATALGEIRERVCAGSDSHRAVLERWCEQVRVHLSTP